MKKLLKTKKGIAFFTSLFLTATLITAFPIMANAADNEKTFDIIEVTDFHGTLKDSSGNPVAGVLADRIGNVKKSNPDRTLILGGGDLYQGSALSNLVKGVSVQKVMSKIGMEVTTLGNHEFDWGLDTITDTTMKDASYSIVCSNLYNKQTGKRVFDPYKIITKDGVKIAVIGGITLETPITSSPKYVKDYEFTDIADEINSVAAEIKKSNLADVTIALVHEGAKGDNATGPIFDIANKLKNVDAVFAGHSHTKTAAIAKTTNIPIFIASVYGKGYIDAKFKITDDKKVVFDTPSLNSSFIALDNENGYKAINPKTDGDVDKIVNEFSKDIEPLISEVIGQNTDKDLTRKLDVSPYGSSVLGNWAADATRDAVKADIGFQNNGGLRIDIPKGNITVGTMWQFMPFDNTIFKLSMTKAQIKEALEQNVADNSKGFQISGIKFTYDSNLPSGQRVKSITREDGTAINDTESLSVAIPDFMAQGGDGFTAFTKYGGSDVANDSHIYVRDALIDWCRSNKDKNDKNTISNVDVPRMVNQGTSSVADWKNEGQAWKYIKDGKAVVGWNKIQDQWYLMDSTGIMQTSWKKVDGKWYFLNDSGAMATGWTYVDENWYYLNSDGSMAKNTTIDGYTLDESGTWVA